MYAVSNTEMCYGEMWWKRLRSDQCGVLWLKTFTWAGGNSWNPKCREEYWLLFSFRCNEYWLPNWMLWKETEHSHSVICIVVFNTVITRLFFLANYQFSAGGAYFLLIHQRLLPFTNKKYYGATFGIIILRTKIYTINYLFIVSVIWYLFNKVFSLFNIH